jgi:hypothetical protein
MRTVMKATALRPTARSRTRRVAVTLLVAWLLAVGAVWGYRAFLGDHPGMVSSPGGWGIASIDDDGRELVVAFIGMAEHNEAAPWCSPAYYGVVTETAEEVRLRIVGKSPGRPRGGKFCNLAGHFREVTVRLQDPLGHRRLIDADTGEVRPLR